MAHPSTNASDSDSQHTFHIAHQVSQRLPKQPAPALVRRSQGELNEKRDTGYNHDLNTMSPRKSPDMSERYNPYFGHTTYDRSSMSSAEQDDLVDQRIFLESKALKILVRLSSCKSCLLSLLISIPALSRSSMRLDVCPSLYLVTGHLHLHCPHLPSTTLVCISPPTL
jgi:hypothetical protein